MSYYLKKLNAIRDCLNQNKYPPVVDEKKWKVSRWANCYAYCLDIPISYFMKRIWEPGRIRRKSGYKKPIDSSMDLLNRVYSDLEFLNISYRENSEELREGEYRIAVYLKPTTYDGPKHFHFSRQDKDGNWSDRQSCRINRIIGNGINAPSMEEYRISLVKTLILRKI